MTMRQSPELKQLAEGWLALLKGDHERAMLSFQMAEGQTPRASKIGQGVVYLVQKKFKMPNHF